MTTGSEERQVASAPTDTTWRHPNGLAGALRPLAVDVATPIATYYLLTGVFGVPLVTALAASSVLPILRTVSGVTGSGGSTSWRRWCSRSTSVASR